MWITLLHLIGALQFSYSVYYDWNYVKVPPSVLDNGINFGGKFIYLTFWDAIVQSVFFWICLLNDLIGSNEINPRKKPAIRKFKDILFCSIAWPLAAFVAATFWGIYAVDRELVLPKALDKYFPTWLNHVMHTNIFIFSVIEMFTAFRNYPPRKRGLTILSLFMLVYLIWTFIIYGQSGQWVYPILQVLNWPQRIGFFIALFLLIQGFYLLGELINKIVWNKELKSSGGSGKKKSDKRKSH